MNVRGNKASFHDPNLVGGHGRSVASLLSPLSTIFWRLQTVALLFYWFVPRPIMWISNRMSALATGLKDIQVLKPAKTERLTIS